MTETQKRLAQLLEELRVYEAELVDPIDTSSLMAMREKGTILVAYLARSASIMAEAKKLNDQEKARQYRILYPLIQRRDSKLTPMMVKDYVEAQCWEHGEILTLAERINRAITHTLDFIRSCMSAEKQLLAIEGQDKYFQT